MGIVVEVLDLGAKVLRCTSWPCKKNMLSGKISQVESLHWWLKKLRKLIPKTLFSFPMENSYTNDCKGQWFGCWLITPFCLQRWSCSRQFSSRGKSPVVVCVCVCVCFFAEVQVLIPSRIHYYTMSQITHVQNPAVTTGLPTEIISKADFFTTHNPTIPKEDGWMITMNHALRCFDLLFKPWPL